MKTFDGAAAARLTRGCFLFCVMVVALSAFKCSSGGGGQQQPTTNLPAGLEPSDVQAAASVLRQRTETEDMVRRFKKQDFNSSQIEFAKMQVRPLDGEGQRGAGAHPAGHHRLARQPGGGGVQEPGPGCG